MSPQTVSATPTNSLATAYSNQKKLAVLSSGREVMVIGDTTTTGQFWHSTDDWVTKTNYSADIGGWLNGSFDVYTDSGGVQRILAAWTQSGTSGTGPTGGARTNGNHYFAVGTLNAGETTITWGAAFDGNTVSANAEDYMDVVVIADGTGAVGHVVSSLNSASCNTRYYKVPINSSGVIGAVTNAAIGGGYGNTGDTFPSICFDPVSKRLHATWSAGTTGGGHGVRYATASYSAGAWTWAAELGVDNSHYIDGSSRFLRARWDAHSSKVVVGGALWDGANIDIVFWESSDFATFGTAIIDQENVTTGSYVPCRGGWAIDPATGDIYMAGISNDALNSAYRKWTRSTTTLGSNVVVEAAQSQWFDVWARSAKIGLLWTALAASPYTVKADKIDLPQNTHQLVNAA